MKNPFDGGFKDLAEDHPELLLRLLGILQPGTKTQITHIPRELQLDAVQIDHGYLIADECGTRIELLEAITSWNARKIGAMALYAFLLWQKYKVPVHCHVLFMAEKYAPKTMSDHLQFEADFGLTIEIPYQRHQLWQIDPAICFEKGSEPLLAWAPLFRGNAEVFEQAAIAIERLFYLGNIEEHKPVALISKLATLASLRYDKNTIKRFLERLEKKIMLSSDAFKVSWLYQEGLEEGRAEAKIGMLRHALQKKFPSIGPIPELDHWPRPEVLDNLLFEIMEAQTLEKARSVILAALNSNKVS